MHSFTSNTVLFSNEQGHTLHRRSWQIRKQTLNAVHNEHSEWVIEWVSEWQSDRETEWLNEKVNEWLSD